MGGKERAKLVTELDREAKWFQKAARHYQTRDWAKDMRTALGISARWLEDEAQVARSTIYRAEQEEKTGAVTIGELEALAEAMECKLVYAIVPERGTVAELAEDWKENPRKLRTEREEEIRLYKEEYARRVEEMRMQDPRNWPPEKWREELKSGDKGIGGQDGLARPLHTPGVQKLMDDVARYGEGAATLEKVKRDVEEWERKHPRRRERGIGTKEQGVGSGE